MEIEAALNSDQTSSEQKAMSLAPPIETENPTITVATTITTTSMDDSHKVETSTIVETVVDSSVVVGGGSAVPHEAVITTPQETPLNIPTQSSAPTPALAPNTFESAPVAVSVPMPGYVPVPTLASPIPAAMELLMHATTQPQPRTLR
eukprot:TRINITY_DN3078_c0_g1_i1.p1 TRINITY_DN3078_c0_g1~~TRINITY_DN3078_c0_g1_i1.p1  ORF type:complete len:148 (-),score=36.88 TRINITY_DN3078_c0_g1_i1:66-509(-)